MLESGQHRFVKRMRLAARIIAYGMTTFGGIMLLGSAIEEGLEANTADGGVQLGIIGVVALIGCIMSWRRERVGGILLVAVAAALGAHIANFAGRNHLLAWTMVGLPYLVAGVLFVNAWRLSRQII
jgi:hypothetical protein